MMDDLIQALQIFRKYGNPKWPTHCEHDELWICGYENADISAADKTRLDELGFFYDEMNEGWKSFRFGSA